MDALAQEAPVRITARAAAHLAKILAKEEPGLKLRVAVNGGGCSGFSYSFAFDDTPTEDDLVLERDGVTVLIDSVSLDMLRGAEIDWVDELIGASFQIKNPNATSSCGCGTSFSI